MIAEIYAKPEDAPTETPAPAKKEFGYFNVFGEKFGHTHKDKYGEYDHAHKNGDKYHAHGENWIKENNPPYKPEYIPDEGKVYYLHFKIINEVLYSIVEFRYKNSQNITF